MTTLMTALPRMQVPLWALAGLAAACAGDLRPRPAGVDGGIPQASAVTFTDAGSGVTSVTVDATAADKWIYVSLSRRAEANPENPATSGDWELAFQRFKIISNGGVHGSGNVQVAALSGGNFETLTRAPATGYLQDAVDGPDDNTEPDSAFLLGDGWYAYNPATHELSPRAVVYVVRGVGGQHFKLRLTRYYDSAGTSGHIGFDYAPVDAPISGPVPTTVDASSTTQWTYVKAATGAVVSVVDPGASRDWDLAFKGSSIRTNGGTSGGGFGGARLAPGGTTYEAITESPTLGFEIDREMPIAGPPGSGTTSANPILNSWYDYDPATHTATPKPIAYLVRTAEGAYAKLRIAGYANHRYEIFVAPVLRNTREVALDVSAAVNGVWTYVSLRHGAVASVADPTLDRTWDLAFSRTNVRTNGGTSGGGQGAAFDPQRAALAAVSTVPQGDYRADEEIPLPGPPGSGTVSANPILSAWYNYDAATHTVSPKDATYVVRCADGSYAKLKIGSYAAGVYSLAVSYAGPGHNTF